MKEAQKKEELKVYLDHHIPREDLLYQRSDDKTSNTSTSEVLDATLKVDRLRGDESHAELLRKPDFQRATWAWSAND